MTTANLNAGVHNAVSEVTGDSPAEDLLRATNGHRFAKKGRPLNIALVTDPIDDNSTGLSSYVRNLVPPIEHLSDDVNLTLVHTHQADFYRGRGAS